MIPDGKLADIGDGLRIHYHDLGPATGNRGTVLFLHGSGPGASGWSNFKHNAPVFAARGLRVIVADNLGFGRSSKPDVDYGLDFVAGGAARLLDRLEIDRCAVVGNSHGGACAIHLALAGRVTRLVLMAPGGLEDREAYMQMSGIRTMMKVFFGPGGISRETMRQVFELQLHDPSRLDDETLDERVACAREQPKRVMSTLAVPNLAPRLAELDVPVFAWWGTGDNFCPSSGAQTIAKQCKDARVMLLSRCGHWVMVEHPALFNRLTLDFLTEDEPAP